MVVLGVVLCKVVVGVEANVVETERGVTDDEVLVFTVVVDTIVVVVVNVRIVVCIVVGMVDTVGVGVGV